MSLLMVGQPVLFYASAAHPCRGERPADLPFAAVIAHINADGTVNLGCLDQNAAPFAALRVPVMLSREGQNGQADYCLLHAPRRDTLGGVLETELDKLPVSKGKLATELA